MTRVKRDKVPPVSPLVGEVDPSTTAGGSSAGGDQSPEPKRRGAPKGNRNNFQHGLNSKRSATENRDTPARKAERRVREMLKTWGVEGDALGESVGDGLRTLHSALYRLTDLGNARGWVDKHGKPKPLLESTMSVLDRLLNNLTKLLDRVAELRSQANPDDGIETRYLVETHDGVICAASWDVAAELRAAGGILPISGPEYVATAPIPELSSRPAEPGADLPREAAWARQEPAQGVPLAEPTDVPSASAGPFLGARGASNQKSLDRKVGRAIRSRLDDGMPAKPADLPDDAIYIGNGQWQFTRGDVTYTTQPTSTERWTPAGGW